jgi:hypothetical protein
MTTELTPEEARELEVVELMKRAIDPEDPYTGDDSEHLNEDGDSDD